MRDQGKIPSLRQVKKLKFRRSPELRRVVIKAGAEVYKELQAQEKRSREKMRLGEVLKLIVR